MCYSAIVLFHNSVIPQLCYSANVLFRNYVIPQLCYSAIVLFRNCGREGGWRIVIPMPEALKCVEGRRQ
jgi:hypothetical protein